MFKAIVTIECEIDTTDKAHAEYLVRYLFKEKAGITGARAVNDNSYLGYSVQAYSISSSVPKEIVITQIRN